ncbi:16S rRNA (guanine(527)-N(7))-methyltransferase RsmG [Psychrosphaera sp. B3R10]|uniref:16S rRNA (guanine(527)-N(7))-methyltransferase RsmG n=1 Tax=unclassified Psychrosphaera TaxID=2641570 RepID=UPI001C082DC2|nr:MULTISPECIES: 16S rRNA (guanine(527)-N(7))-methyltransferase RsmG [unclassified Psychrosphaera]MBU2883310.1 16S rRNA (guanine(527)-N(7))-methyltransferase RsmG [Psychrosphaera sp. I2R16]MBU2990596.1 16S rRNA (guanine(527)-N(7))-methyltransferase RsmG [Psychrosphaera sp. B3R10]
MLKNKLTKLIAQTDLKISDLQIDQLVAYVELLHKWNKAYNLTSVREPEQMLIKHIMDSLVVSPHLLSVTNINNKFIDVGTGPGLPGIPLAIINPDLEFTLLDSLGKRVRFMTQVKLDLGLKNIIPVQSRVEDFEGEFAGVLSRAFASISDMVNWSRHLVAPNGRFFALKGQLAQEEIEALPDFVKVDSIAPLVVPNLNAERHLVLLKSQ